MTKSNIGVDQDSQDPQVRLQLAKSINLKLASMGLPMGEHIDNTSLEAARQLLESFQEKDQMLGKALCPVDTRIQNFLDDYFAGTGEEVPHLPTNTFVLDRYGLARELSLPGNGKEFHREDLHSYRVKQGVLHNPKSDRRTTKGVFHVAEGGLPVPPDKKAVPKIAFQRILRAALEDAPEDLMELPYTSEQEEQARCFVSLLLRPLVCPKVEGVLKEKKMEIRFFAPGNLVSNLDFVESIFSNGGDPYLPANDSALDPEHWTGHTGCVILAPHISNLKKKDLGLPHISKATERQIAEDMAWEKENELYNSGGAFKITCRDDRGTIVTIISDNYFGYCKKEVKTQIGYSANLFGLTEEEHAGGALAFPSYNLGAYFLPDSNLKARKGHNFKNVIKCLGDAVEVKPEGYGVDKNYPAIHYIPENASISLDDLRCSWIKDGKGQYLKVLPNRIFVHPTGYKIRLEKHPQSTNWRLIGTTAEGTLVHKPCTVSGGGKSEISKSLYDAIIYGPVFVGNFQGDMNQVESIIARDYSDRYSPEHKASVGLEEDYDSRPILDPKRSLGSVIKLLNPSSENTDEFNTWLESIPNHIKALVFLVKRFYKREWGDQWRRHFSVDIVNGEPGHQLKFGENKVWGSYLRVGLQPDGTWWTCKLRQDMMPAEKIQWEDDITASVVVPSWPIEEGLSDEYKNPSVKIVENCEGRFFQRPDEAKVRGFDKQAEADLATPGVFISNFEPLTKERAISFVEDAVHFNLWTEPMKKLIREVASEEGDQLFVSSAHARIVDGSPTKNVRYLQTRPDLLNNQSKYLALVGMRLYRQIEAKNPLYTPVNAVMPGRRNNPADRQAGIRPLAVYNPIHFQELPELFMDFTCSLTGKSPSTTGAGSEGALTKGPFNALVATADLNNALLSFILTGYNGFSTAAGYIGTEHPVEHDVSLLVPELWSRLSEAERDPRFLIENGYLEKIEDFDYEGERVLASRLGYRITSDFVNAFLGRLFEAPNVAFGETILRPEVQSKEDFVDGVKNICEAQAKVGKAYLKDGSDASAIPPLRAILHIMATGSYEGKGMGDPEVRKLFDRDYVINSDWYKERLRIKQERDVRGAEDKISYLENFIANPKREQTCQRLQLREKLSRIKEELNYFRSEKYLEHLVGTIGADPLFRG